MDRESKKRGREEPSPGRAVAEATAEISKKKGKKHEASSSSSSSSASLDAFFFEEGGGSSFTFETDDAFHQPPLGVFDFPWQKQGEAGLLPPDSAAWDRPEAFFSSLVDGCSAAIGVDGDRLSPTTPTPLPLPDDDDKLWPSDGESDGLDCIWSTVLRQPLSTGYSKAANA